MTEFIPAQLAKPAPKNKPLGDPFWDTYTLEPKHDGMRAVVVVGDDGEVQVQSRTDKPYALHVPHLVDWFETFPKGTVLDGELAVIDRYEEVFDQYVPVVDFNATMRIMGSGWEKAVARQDPNTKDSKQISFIIFDALRYEKVDLTALHQVYRRRYVETIRKYLPYYAPIVANPEFTISSLYTEIYDVLLAKGIEGAVMKNTYAEYVPGKRQNKAWYKFKTVATADVVVTGFTDAKEGVGGKYLGQIGAIKFGAYDEKGILHEIGQTSGMNDELRLWWTNVRDTGDKESYVIEIKYNDLVGTEEYKTPRHPQYITKRDDKEPKDCLMDQFQ